MSFDLVVMGSKNLLATAIYMASYGGRERT
jgi:hypothetical protein